MIFITLFNKYLLESTLKNTVRKLKDELDVYLIFIRGLQSGKDYRPIQAMYNTSYKLHAKFH